MTENTETVSAEKVCQCAQWIAIHEEYSDPESGADEGIAYSTGCNSTTKKDFAPGHDAKLKSLLIQAGADRLEITDQAGLFSDAMNVAKRYGFAYMVEQGIQRVEWKRAANEQREAGKAKRQEERAARHDETAVAKAQRAAAKKSAKVEEASTPETSKIKIGRWEYDAEINEFGLARYTDGKGELQERESGTYRLLLEG